MTDGIPTMPRWTDPRTGRFSAGRAFGNTLDALVPFDIYNSQTGMYNRNNAIAGGLSMVNPLAGLGAYAYMNRDQLGTPRFSNPFSGWLQSRTGVSGLGVREPSRFASDRRDISDRAIGEQSVGGINPDMFAQDAENISNRASTHVRPQFQSPAAAGRIGNPGGTGRYGGSVRLGAGALGSAGDAALQQYIQSLYSRGGTMQER